jgi:hypothetical protein
VIAFLQESAHRHVKEKMRGKAKEMSAGIKVSFEVCDERRIKHIGKYSAKQHIVNVFRQVAGSHLYAEQTPCW